MEKGILRTNDVSLVLLSRMEDHIGQAFNESLPLCAGVLLLV